MNAPSSIQRYLLVAAILVPFVYFGAQALAAPYFPDYSLLTTSASALGSDLSSRPSILNTGALLTGVLALLGSIGLATALPRAGAGRVAAWTLGLCVASAGLASLWAGWHPLPSPRHNPGALGLGMFLAPFAALFAIWRLRPAKALRTFLLSNAALFVVLAAILSGVLQIDLRAYGGLVQKILAASAFSPGAVIAAALLSRAGTEPRDRALRATPGPGPRDD